jgi:uncharacterized protein
MELSAEEARVLACLVEKQATVPDSYPLTLNALRSACNQSSNRSPVVSYDDRTIEAALISLKSIGLVAFVHPSHGGRTLRYRHRADERWHLEPNELAVLSVLTLRGPQTAGEVRARIDRQFSDDGMSVDDALDSLAARHPDAFARRLDRRPGEREPRWMHLLSGEVEPEAASSRPADDPTEAATPGTSAGVPAVEDLAADVAVLRARLDRLEELLGVEPLEPPND